MQDASLTNYDPNLPYLFEDEFPHAWQMTRWEKYAFISLVRKRKPSVAIEIGNATGGSLQVLASVCNKVYAIDFQQVIHDGLKDKFSNHVEFHTGDSKVLLPEILKKIQESNEELGFVFIDGNHSTEGVKADINCVLNGYTPICELIIIFHDSFNPECRRGIIDADWKKNQYVHYVDVDFIPGNFYKEPLGACKADSIWNGLSFALLKPEIRKGDLEIRQTLQPSYDIFYKASLHNNFTNKYWYPMKKYLKKNLRKVGVIK